MVMATMLRAIRRDDATGWSAAQRTAIHAGPMTATVPPVPRVITASIYRRLTRNGMLVLQGGGEDSSPPEPCARAKGDALRYTESGYYPRGGDESGSLIQRMMDAVQFFQRQLAYRSSLLCFNVPRTVSLAGAMHQAWEPATRGVRFI